MRALSLLITLPLLVVIAVFSVVNRQAVTLNLWPLQETVELPLFVVVLCGTAIGLLAGAAIGWLSAGPARRRVREERARVRALEARLAELSRQQMPEVRTEVRTEPAGGWLRLAGGRS
jgi:uncharacterized integral membrane protein